MNTNKTEPTTPDPKQKVRATTAKLIALTKHIRRRYDAQDNAKRNNVHHDISKPIENQTMPFTHINNYKPFYN